MTFTSPSHAWATWLDRPNDLILAAGNAATVRAALDALEAGKRALAGELWASIDGNQMLEAWNAQVKAMRDKSRWPDSLFEPPEVWGEKTTKPLTTTLSSAVFERDGYRCSYCGVPVVTQRRGGHVPGLVTEFGEVTPWLRVVDGSLLGSGKSGALRNVDVGKWLWVTAVADHVHPAALGGPTEMWNLATACSNCNYSKADWTLTQLQVVAPRIPAGAADSHDVRVDVEW